MLEVMAHALLRAGKPTVRTENWRIQESPVIEKRLNMRTAQQFTMRPQDGSTSPEGQVTQMTDGGAIQLEPCFDHSAICELMRIGQKVNFAKRVCGGYQAIRRDEANSVYISVYLGCNDG